MSIPHPLSPPPSSFSSFFIASHFQKFEQSFLRCLLICPFSAMTTIHFHSFNNAFKWNMAQMKKRNRLDLSSDNMLERSGTQRATDSFGQIYMVLYFNFIFLSLGEFTRLWFILRFLCSFFWYGFFQLKESN